MSDSCSDHFDFSEARTSPGPATPLHTEGIKKVQSTKVNRKRMKSRNTIDINAMRVRSNLIQYMI